MKKHGLRILLTLFFISTSVNAQQDEIFINGFEFDTNADVVSVTTTGTSGQYTFSVGVLSPDINCDQYADWWEILDQNQLIYRRILGHSHATEQPFVRNSSSLGIQAEDIVWIRAHMNNGSYGGMVFTGSVNTGFSLTKAHPNWPADIEFEEPQVMSCAF